MREANELATCLFRQHRTAADVFYYVMHRLYLGVLYFQNVIWIEGTSVTVVYNFRLHEKYGLPGADFHKTGQ